MIDEKQRTKEKLSERGRQAVAQAQQTIGRQIAQSVEWDLGYIDPRA